MNSRLEKITKPSAILVGLLLLAAGARVYANDGSGLSGLMQPGLWTKEVHTQMEGVPVPVPPSTTTDCITAADLDDVSQLFAAAQQKRDKAIVATLQQFERNGNTVHFKETFSGKHSGEAEGDVSFSTPQAYTA
ncbi:MAG TPA: hypothetical protein VFK45_00455, partial [Gammaproteobacteria bacterium]|nr:hypothetical protein [Gammaproteobacteria bacterium]